MINTVIFDFDGVIEDNYEHHFELSTKQIRGLTREEHRMLFEGNIHEQREKLRDRDTGFDLPKIFNESKVTLKTREEVRDSLVKLASQYRLGIISSAMEYGLNTYLLNNGLNNLFSFVYGKETHWSKVEKFEMAKNNFGLDNDNIVFVTDTLGDIVAANKIGVKTIAVDFGFHERERLARGNPYRIVSSFSQIISSVTELEKESN